MKSCCEDDELMVPVIASDQQFYVFYCVLYVKFTNGNYAGAPWSCNLFRFAKGAYVCLCLPAITPSVQTTDVLGQNPDRFYGR